MWSQRSHLLSPNLRSFPTISTIIKNKVKNYEKKIIVISSIFECFHWDILGYTALTPQGFQSETEAASTITKSGVWRDVFI